MPPCTVGSDDFPRHRGLGGSVGPGDKNGAAAKSLYGAIGSGRYGAIATTDFVLGEAATLIRMATDADTAARFIRTVRTSPSATIVWTDERHFDGALDLLERHADKRWSFTDCTSLVVMRGLGIDSAFAFDHNSEEAGYTRLP